MSTLTHTSKVIKQGEILPAADFSYNSGTIMKEAAHSAKGLLDFSLSQGQGCLLC